MQEHEININSTIIDVIIFSGGGGIVRRHASASLVKGLNLLKLDGIPVSFDPETFQIDISPESVKVKQFTTTIPTRKYIIEQLNKESEAAASVINSSVEIGNRRKEIIKVAEDVIKRDFFDEMADVRVFTEVNEDTKIEIEYSYIIADFRLKWSPFITVNLLSDDEAEVNCTLTIDNQTAYSYESIEVKFVEFSLPSAIYNGLQEYTNEPADITPNMPAIAPRIKTKKWENQVLQQKQLLY